MGSTKRAFAIAAMIGLGAWARGGVVPAAADDSTASSLSVTPLLKATVSLPVKVTNTAGDWAAPVPTVAQGTTNVAGTVTANAQQSGAWNVGINGTPTVHAQQSGPWSVTAEQGAAPWSVSISGTPTVGLAAGTAVAVSGSVNVVNTPTVSIGNTAASPALVRNTDEHARQPFQQFFLLNIDDGSFVSPQVDVVVPPNKRLVIDFVSGSFGNLPTGQIPYLIVQGTAAGMGTAVPVWPTRVGTVLGTEIWGVNAPFRLYGDAGDHDAGTNVAITGARTGEGTGFASYRVTLSGYFIDL